MPEDPTPPHPTAPPHPASTETASTEPAITETATTPTAGTEVAATLAPPLATATPASTSPVPAVPDIGYTAAGVPTFDGIREKIETRYATALGATELAEDTTEGRTATQQFDARQKAAEEKLAEIRASMHKSD